MSITSENMPGVKTANTDNHAIGHNDADLPISRKFQSRSVAKRSKIWWIVGLPIGAVILVAVVFLIVRQFSGPGHQLVYYTVTRGDLAINVTERGAIESQENVRIICKVDDVRDDGFRGTPISWIIRNGKKVKRGNLQECAASIGLMWAQSQSGQGSFFSCLAGAAIFPQEVQWPDLLVELEDDAHVERLDRQILDRTAALAKQIEATAKYENQQTQNETLKANAELELKLAELELAMFDKMKRIPIPFGDFVLLQTISKIEGDFQGTFKLELDEIDRKVDDINTQILTAKADFELAKKDLRATESLFKLGYAGKRELDGKRLEVLRTEAKYSTSISSLQTQRAARVKKIQFEKIKQSLTLKGNVATANRKLIQVIRDNESLLQQAKAKKDEADRLFKKEDERMMRYEEGVRNCKIYAPVDGMIAYASKDPRRWWMDEIKQGSPVQPRQHMLSIPNLSKMQVKTSVHESVIDEVHKGLPATIRLESSPPKFYAGTVESVAVLADQQSHESKVYETIVTIDGEVKINSIKPGMTAVVEIHIGRKENVLSVPVQAVVQVRNTSWCYVASGSGCEKRIVKLGETNHKFVVITKGIKEGESVVLNPMVIVEQTESEEQETLSPDSGPQAPQTEFRNKRNTQNSPPRGKGNGKKGQNRKKKNG